MRRSRGLAAGATRTGPSPNTSANTARTDARLHAGGGSLAADHHETHLPSLQSSSCPHPWFSRAHEDARGARGHQRAAREGAQASLGLKPSPRGMDAGPPALRLQTLRTAAAFQRLLRERPCGISAHFAVHHLAAEVEKRPQADRAPVVRDLSTERETELVPFVDESPRTAASSRYALGVVVPKRHARRAVTRSLIKREVRAAWRCRASALDAGLWLVRLRAGFEASRYPSAASVALRAAVRLEVGQVLDRCVIATAASSAA